MGLIHTIVVGEARLDSSMSRLSRQGSSERSAGGQDHQESSEVLHVERVYIQIPNKKKGVVESKSSRVKK